MTDIHAIIAAAKRTSHRDSHSMDKLLCDHAIAMAEALAHADALIANGRPADAAMVIGDCLDKIVKEANRG